MNSVPSEEEFEYQVVEQELTPAESSPAQESERSGSLLDSLIEVSATVTRSELSNRLNDFLQAPTVGDSLNAWLGNIAGYEKEQLVRRLNSDVAYIDQLVNDQLNTIIHHPKFQKLESSWRGLNYLVNTVEEEGDPNTLVRVLDMKWSEVERDLDRAIDFDDSQLFRKIYEEEFGTAGGKPFGVLIGDYQIQPRPTPDHPHRDIDTLQKLSGVAAAAFCPFIAGVSPTMFGVDQFTGLEHVNDLSVGFEQPEFIEWNAFRKTDDARYVALALPHILMRKPYEPDPERLDGFCFREEVAGTDRSKYLWGNAAFAMGEVLIRAYAQCGWFAQIRGVQRNVLGGGLVTGLPVQHFGTDRQGVAPKCSSDLMITDHQEADLSQLGFLPLTHCHDTEYSSFYSNPTIQNPKEYHTPAATQNAKISAMLQYIMCASQFAHYLKVQAREKIGSFLQAEDLERFLHDWIYEYVTPDETAKPEVKARRPLRQADVRVRADPNNPGSYVCTMDLWPHYQLDDLVSSIRMKTKIEKRGS
ncbi:MAG: type VI secretion system contractile sheath large subunit [Blastopirellula sp.]|nr:MAG: type VI secretion system contractile sheath large subunit [Blastopirellula sp.]